jgi:hypothetical protein
MRGAGSPHKNRKKNEGRFSTNILSFVEESKKSIFALKTSLNGRVAVRAVQLGLFLSLLIRDFRERRKIRRQLDLSLFLICLRRGRLPVSQFSVPASGKLLLLSRTLSYGVSNSVFFCYDW